MRKREPDNQRMRRPCTDEETAYVFSLGKKSSQITSCELLGMCLPKCGIQNMGETFQYLHLLKKR